jgi:hypothetical protein
MMVYSNEIMSFMNLINLSFNLYLLLIMFMIRNLLISFKSSSKKRTITFYHLLIFIFIIFILLFLIILVSFVISLINLLSWYDQILSLINHFYYLI